MQNANNIFVLTCFFNMFLGWNVLHLIFFLRPTHRKPRKKFAGTQQRDKRSYVIHPKEKNFM